MNRQLFKLWPRVCLVLLCVVATAGAGPDKENLVFYLSCDNAANPVDESGDPATTVLHGSLTSVPGQLGTKGLGFDGNKANRIQVLNNLKLDGMSTLTIEAWAQPRNLALHGAMVVVSKASGGQVSHSYTLWTWQGWNVYGRINGNTGAELQTTTTLQDGVWYHLAFVFDGQSPANERMKLYVNGILDTTSYHPDTRVNQSESSLWVGDVGEFTEGFNWDGALDEIGIWNAALTADEIGQLMVQNKASLLRTGTAGNPQPPNGALHPDTWVTLSWRPGYFATSHDVYLGDNFDDVNDATLDSETFRGNQAGKYFVVGFPGFPYPDGLVPGTTYYWRIDEVNDAEPNSPWKGPIWSFLVPPKTAYEPLPADGSKFIAAAAVTLGWTPGLRARLHTVYFGEDFDTVNNAVVGIPITLATYKPGPLKTETTYYWRVDEYDGITTYKGDIWSFTTAKAGGGVQGQYYKGMNFNTLVLTRIDPEINFDWGTGAPDRAVGADQFSVRWTGEVEAAFTETYTFYTRTDDGVRLWVGGQQLIDDWTDHDAAQFSGQLDLVAGNTYSLVMEMYENGVDAVAQLLWSSPHTPKQIIPQGALSPPK